MFPETVPSAIPLWPGLEGSGEGAPRGGEGAPRPAPLLLVSISVAIISPFCTWQFALDLDYLVCNLDPGPICGSLNKIGNSVSL